MRVSEFWRLMNDEFGEASARSLAKDLVVSALGERTALQALEQGEDLRVVWRALRDAMDVEGGRRDVD